MAILRTLVLVLFLLSLFGGIGGGKYLTEVAPDKSKAFACSVRGNAKTNGCKADRYDLILPANSHRHVHFSVAALHDQHPGGVVVILDHVEDFKMECSNTCTYASISSTHEILSRPPLRS